MILVLVSIIQGCYDIPTFSDVPSISFNKVEFFDVNSGQDSLLITINFADGDGDIGLNDDYNYLDAFQSNEYLIDGNDGYIDISEIDELITIKDVGKDIAPLYEHFNTGSKSKSTLTTIPPFDPPYQYTNWLINPKITLIDLDTVFSGGNWQIRQRYIEVQMSDTVFFMLNENHFNFFVDFYYKDSPTDEFKKFNWVTDITFPPGQPPHGRVPILHNPNEEGIIEGTIKYGFVSSGLLNLFEDKILKLQIRIQDRALNSSQTVETPEFTLREIQVN